MYYGLEIKDNTYKLRLNTKNVVLLEKQLGKNPLMIFDEDKLPTITEMVMVLHASLLQLNHGITLDKAYSLFDDYLEDGHTITDFINVIIEIYKVSGIIKVDDEKN